MTGSGPSPIRGTFAVPYLVIENIMACKVFRDVRLGLIDPHPSLNCSNLSQFNACPAGRHVGTGMFSNIVFGRVSLAGSETTSIAAGDIAVLRGIGGATHTSGVTPSCDPDVTL